MKRYLRIVSIVLAVTVLLSLVLSTAVSAQGPGGSGGRGPQRGGRATKDGFPGDRPGLVRTDKGIQLSVIADLLGITVEELQEALEGGATVRDLLDEAGIDAETVQQALEAARIEAIEQAVEDGELTQEQADRLLERMAEKGLDPFERAIAERFMPQFRNWVGHIADMARGLVRRAFEQGMRYGRFLGLTELTQDTRLGILADALDMTEGEVEAALEEGTTLAELAEQQGVELEVIQEALCQARLGELDEAVEEGRISQEAADRLYQQIEETGCRAPRPSLPRFAPQGEAPQP